jgi:hypothetical protein
LAAIASTSATVGPFAEVFIYANEFNWNFSGLSGPDSILSPLHATIVLK